MGTSANWSRENLAWAAGLFEGEGSIIRRRKKETNLVLATTDFDVLSKFCSILGHGRIYGPYTRPNTKPIWRWSCSGSKNCIAILAALWTFLGVRRKERAALAMADLATIRSRGSNFCKRGHPFDESNSILEGAGRVCRRCKYDGINSRAKEKRLRLKEQKNEPQFILGHSDGRRV